MAFKTVGTDLYQSARGSALCRANPIRVEKSQERDAAGDLSEGGRTPDGEIKPFMAGTFSWPSKRKWILSRWHWWTHLIFCP